MLTILFILSVGSPLFIVYGGRKAINAHFDLLGARDNRLKETLRRKKRQGIWIAVAGLVIFATAFSAMILFYS